jgi:hypothetical protein
MASEATRDQIPTKQGCQNYQIIFIPNNIKPLMKDDPCAYTTIIKTMNNTNYIYVGSSYGGSGNKQYNYITNLWSRP